MPVWIKNLEMALENKQIIILHGNVRDLYLDEHGNVYENLTALLLNVAKESTRNFEQVIFYDKGKGERRIDLKSTPSKNDRIENNKRYTDELDMTAPQPSSSKSEPPARVFARWLNELNDNSKKLLYVIFYFDKIISYSSHYNEGEQELLLWLEKIIENIADNNRIILVSLMDSMVPIEIYTSSPKCKIISINIPEREDRELYLKIKLGKHEHLELIASLTDGMYIRELGNIVDEIKSKDNLSTREIRKLINRYKIGVQQDYWGALSLEKLDGAFNWFTNIEGVKGQDEAIKKLIQVISMARAGLSGIASGTVSKPRGVLFFAGPTGVGKTFVAKKLAKFLFDTEEAFIRFDMSEFKEEHSISKFIGSPPGYVGYEQGGMLTNAIKLKPFSVVLFDEVEKAHPKIMDIFLQILDEGRLTDSRGQTVFFTETVIIFTSNIGCRTTDSKDRPIDEKQALEYILSNKELSEIDKKYLIRQHFVRCVEDFFINEISRPELLNRIGNNIVPFNYIQSDDIQLQIVNSHLRRIKEDFEDKFKQSNFKLIIDDSVPTFLVRKYSDWMTQFGGRGITSSIENDIIVKLAQAVLKSEYNNEKDLSFKVKAEDSIIKIEKQK